LTIIFCTTKIATEGGIANSKNTIVKQNKTKQNKKEFQALAIQIS
jgi:hypothetical protein